MTFKKLKHPDELINRIQDQISSALDPLLKPDTYIKVKLFAGKDNVISHLLGKAITGFEIVDKDASCNIWRIANSTPTLTITLKTTADVNVSLRIF